MPSTIINYERRRYNNIQQSQESGRDFFRELNPSRSRRVPQIIGGNHFGIHAGAFPIPSAPPDVVQDTNSVKSAMKETVYYRTSNCICFLCEPATLTVSTEIKKQNSRMPCSLRMQHLCNSFRRLRASSGHASRQTTPTSASPKSFRKVPQLAPGSPKMLPESPEQEINQLPY